MADHEVEAERISGITQKALGELGTGNIWAQAIRSRRH